jgi:hypothetical protein
MSRGNTFSKRRALLGKVAKALEEKEFISTAEFTQGNLDLSRGGPLLCVHSSTNKEYKVRDLIHHLNGYKIKREDSYGRMEIASYNPSEELFRVRFNVTGSPENKEKKLKQYLAVLPSRIKEENF